MTARDEELKTVKRQREQPDDSFVQGCCVSTLQTPRRLNKRVNCSTDLCMWSQLRTIPHPVSLNVLDVSRGRSHIVSLPLVAVNEEGNWYSCTWTIAEAIMGALMGPNWRCELYGSECRLVHRGKDILRTPPDTVVPLHQSHANIFVLCRM